MENFGFFAKVQQSPEIQSSLNPKYHRGTNPAQLKALKLEVCTEQLLTLSSERIQSSERRAEKGTHSGGHHS